MPQQIEQLSPLEMRELLHGDHLQYVRLAKLAAWHIAFLQAAVYRGAAAAIDNALGGRMDAPEFDWERLLRSIPGFEE